MLKDFWEGMYLIFLKIMKYILFFTPYGVFCLVAKATMNFSPESYIFLLNFFITVLVGLFIHIAVIYPLILYFFKKNIVQHFKGMSPALLVAFSSSSSVATIPVTSKCLIDNLHYKEENVNFIIPIGATINMDGTSFIRMLLQVFLCSAVSQIFLILINFYIVTSFDYLNRCCRYSFC